jgi:OOP family OmpA-OmpF porin
LESVLKGLSGRTMVYIFSDGGHEQATTKGPVNRTAELARKYNVCFIVVSYATNPSGIKLLQDMSNVNSCSRVIPFDAYITNPYYATGILYYKKTETSVETTSKQKIYMKVNDIRFDYDKFELTPQEKDELNQLGKFLYANPQAFAAVQGFTDNRGTLDYNLELSRRRAEKVADYLMKNFKLDAGRVAVMWYGEGNPVDSNNTAEGRAKNRRVEVAVSSLSL